MLTWISKNDGEPTDLEMEEIHKAITRCDMMKESCAFVYNRIKRICKLAPVALKNLDEQRKKSPLAVTGGGARDKSWSEVREFLAAVCAGTSFFIVFVTWYVGWLYSFVYPLLSFSVAVRGHLEEGKELNAFQTFLFAVYAGFMMAVIVMQMTVQNNYLAVVGVVVPLDDLLDDIYDEAFKDDEAVKAKKKNKNDFKKAQERIKKKGKEAEFESMFDKFFSKQAGENFRTPGNSGWFGSCRDTCCWCCCPTQVKQDDYELVPTEE
jgi:hypothetical protein